jgi:hypothetical protein
MAFTILEANNIKMNQENPFGGDAWERNERAAQAADAAQVAELDRRKEARESVREGVINGTVEVPPEVDMAVKKASDAFWDKFDDYVRNVRSGQPSSAPSRNAHRADFKYELSKLRLGEVAEVAGDVRWGTYFDQEAAARNLPLGGDNAIDVMNGILYEGKIPEDIKVDNS